jgi:hypothetical protein
LHQIGYEIELPIRALPLGGKLGLPASAPLHIRLVAFFRRIPSIADLAKSRNVVDAAIENNRKESALPIDGIARLKYEISQNLQPEELHFYNTFSGGDLMIVRQDGGLRCDERKRG